MISLSRMLYVVAQRRCESAMNAGDSKVGARYYNTDERFNYQLGVGLGMMFSNAWHVARLKSTRAFPTICCVSGRWTTHTTTWLERALSRRQKTADDDVTANTNLILRVPSRWIYTNLMTYTIIRSRSYSLSLVPCQVLV